MDHPFINHGGSIPKLLPVSTIACPPSASYIKQFLPQGNTVKVTVQPQRLIDTAPQGQLNDGKSGQRANLISTEKVSLGKEVTGTEQPAGTMQFNMINSTNLKDSLRPTTVQQKDFKSTQNLKTGPSSTNFGPPGGAVGGSMGNATKKSTDKSEIWVKKWVDYSSKYGLGYLLSNGITGVFFNDSTKIILDPKGSVFEYMERRPTDKQDIVNNYTLTDYPKELQKKVTLLQHFRSYLEGDNKDAQPTEEEQPNQQKTPTVYVKKWMKTKHAIMFRLSNKIVQVNFTDKTEIILSSENKIVTYVNKKGERSNYPLATALESSNSEMAKRLKYTKEILTHMLNNNNAAQPQTAAPANLEEMP